MSISILVADSVHGNFDGKTGCDEVPIHPSLITYHVHRAFHARQKPQTGFPLRGMVECVTQLNEIERLIRDNREQIISIWQTDLNKQ